MTAPGAYLASRREAAASALLNRPSYWRTWRGRHRTTSVAGDAVHRDGCPVIAREFACTPWRQMDGQPDTTIRVEVAIDDLLTLCAVCFSDAPMTRAGARMTSELVHVKPGQAGAPPATLQDRVAYAKELADNGLLPRAYQRQPGNILVAEEKAAQLRIPVMAAIDHFDNIEGKLTPNGKLLSYLVRRAGHRLRPHPVTGSGKAMSAKVEIRRADDPDFPFIVEFSLDDAENAKLTGKDNWKKYPKSMLMWRALSGCVNLACPEVLIDAFGVSDVGQIAGFDFIDGEVIPPVDPVAAGDIADAELVEPQTSTPTATGDGQESGRVPEGNRTPVALRSSIWQHAHRLWPSIDVDDDLMAEVEGEFAQMFDGTALRNATPEELRTFDADLAQRHPVSS